MTKENTPTHLSHSRQRACHSIPSTMSRRYIKNFNKLLAVAVVSLGIGWALTLTAQNTDGQDSAYGVSTDPRFSHPLSYSYHDCSQSYGSRGCYVPAYSYNRPRHPR